MSDTEPFVLLGVMSNPFKPVLRQQWREWGSRFSSYQHSVRVRYVFGTSEYVAGEDHSAATRGASTMTTAESVHPSVRRWTQREEKDHGDLLYVDGREKLPHVGVVTEKSAAYWLSAAAREPAARWMCKCDDDTLVHLDRLTAALRMVEARVPAAAL